MNNYGMYEKGLVIKTNSLYMTLIILKFIRLLSLEIYNRILRLHYLNQSNVALNIYIKKQIYKQNINIYCNNRFFFYYYKFTGTLHVNVNRQKGKNLKRLYKVKH